MDIYASDDEQAEALKKWWRENGKSVFGGVALGLAGVFGWQSWVEHQDSQKGVASYKYFQIAQAARQGDTESVIKQVELLDQQQGDTVYAQFAALELAKLKIEAGDLEGARLPLERVLRETGDVSLRQVARIRLARLLLDQGKLDQAQATLASAPADAFQGEISALKGDIALKRGDLVQARDAYRAAIADGSGNRELIQLKLDSLGGQERG